MSTHDFLKEEDCLYYKEQLPVYFQYVTLFGFEQEGILIGFMGIAEGNLEMLFIDNNYRGTGIGKKLVTYAINHLQVTKVDVNEQNIQAVGFYKYIGFNVYKRSDLDGEGKEYRVKHSVFRRKASGRIFFKQEYRLCRAVGVKRVGTPYFLRRFP